MVRTGSPRRSSRGSVLLTVLLLASVFTGLAKKSSKKNRGQKTRAIGRIDARNAVL